MKIELIANLPYIQNSLVITFITKGKKYTVKYCVLYCK